MRVNVLFNFAFLSVIQMCGPLSRLAPCLFFLTKLLAGNFGTAGGGGVEDEGECPFLFCIFVSHSNVRSPPSPRAVKEDFLPELLAGNLCRGGETEDTSSIVTDGSYSKETRAHTHRDSI